MCVAHSSRFMPVFIARSGMGILEMAVLYGKWKRRRLVGDASDVSETVRLTGSGGRSWVAVGVGFFFRGGCRDAVSLAQPATQIDLPTAAAAKGELGPVGLVSQHFASANRAV